MNFSAWRIASSRLKEVPTFSLWSRFTDHRSGGCRIHEIKHDGYRLIVQRDDKRVRLFTRSGHDWSNRFPLISEAALRYRNSSFVIDGEAVTPSCWFCRREQPT